MQQDFTRNKEMHVTAHIHKLFIYNAGFFC